MEPDWTRITLRLPNALHRRLVESAGNASLNSEIVQILQNGLGPEQTAGTYHYLDAFEADVLVRARVVARFQLAAADHIDAHDVVFIERGLAARIAATGAKIHDAAKAAIEAAFPAELVGPEEILDVLKSGEKAGIAALIERLERQVAGSEGRRS